MTDEHHHSDSDFLRNAVEASIRIGLIALLVILCYEVVRPLMIPIVWGIILAIALYPAFRLVTKWLNGREFLASGLITLLVLIVLIVPIGLIAVPLVENIQLLATELRAGSLKIPPPPETFLNLPLIGKKLDHFWTLASQNFDAFLVQFQPQLTSLAGVLLKSGTSIGFGLLIFVIAIFISGILLTQADNVHRAILSAAHRFIGVRGKGFVELAGNTIRNVAMGVVGVALIQGILASVGLVVAGIPFAGMITFAVILLTILQIGPAIILIPAMIYAFMALNSFTAIIFTIWTIPVMLLDNILKPILMARGIDVPMIVIFIGVIGGTLSFGLTGLFIGPVILALGYNIGSAWIYGLSETSEPIKLRDGKGQDDSFSTSSGQFVSNGRTLNEKKIHDVNEDNELALALIQRAGFQRGKSNYKSSENDLREAFNAANRCGIPATLADCYLEYGRLALDANKKNGSAAAQQCYLAAKKIVNEENIVDKYTELDELKKRLGGLA